jgi:hypothetical protein
LRIPDSIGDFLFHMIFYLFFLFSILDWPLKSLWQFSGSFTETYILLCSLLLRICALLLKTYGACS